MKRKIKRHLILMKHYKQHTEYSCGIACLRMLLERFGKNYKESFLRDLTNCNEEGTDITALKRGLKILGFKSSAHYSVSLKQLIKKLNKNIPIMVGFQEHWQIVIGYDKKYIFTIDPAHDRPIKRINKKRFLKLWKTEYNQALEIK